MTQSSLSRAFVVSSGGTRSMRCRLRTNIVLIFVLLLILPSNSKATAGQSPENNHLEGFKRYDGFIPLWVNKDKNLVYFELSSSALSRDFILRYGA